MSNLTPLQVAQYAYQAGFRGVYLIYAVAVSLAENHSSNPNAQCLNCAGVTEDSRGLWQINVLAHPEYNTSSIYDPLTNAKAAFAVSNNGTDFSPWSTFTNGAYKAFLVQATNVATEVTPGFPGSVGNPAGSNPPDPTGAGPQLPPAITDPVQAAKDSLAGVAATINGVGQTIASAANGVLGPLTTFTSDVTNLLSFIGDKRVVVGAVMVGIGGIITILGIVLFGLSLIPSQDGAKALKAATTVAV